MISKEALAARRRRYATDPAYRERQKANAVKWNRANRALRRARMRQTTLVRLAYVDSLKTGGCVDCGNKNLSVLEFDHLRDKKWDLSAMRTHSWAAIDAEIAKCEVRCANCHRLKTVERRREAARRLDLAS